MTRLLLIALFLGSCAKVAINRDGLACADDSDCLQGYACNFGTGLCDRVGGDTSSAGDSGDGGDSNSGDQGNAGDPNCELGLLGSCSTCTDDCTISVLNATPTCEAVTGGHACSYGTCAEGYVDTDSDRTNGCDYQCTPAGNETCNGVDDDCDRDIDDVTDIDLDCNTILSTPQQVEHFACDATACTTHCCVIDTCQPTYVDADDDPATGCEEVCDPPNPGVEICDGEDNNCDGEVDNAADDATDCTPYFIDADDDTYGVGTSRCMCAPEGDYTATVDGDCADGDGNVHPNVTEVCNNTDDDCVAGIDDALGATCWCADGANQPRAEICNYIDDNCDGTIDDDLGVSCWCTDGVNAPTSEICNTIDDNCDGTLDDNLGTACRCTDGLLAPLDAEDCGAGSGNTVDDNCDGQVDEGCVRYLQPSNLPVDVDTCQSGVVLTVGDGETVTFNTDDGTATGVTFSSMPPTLNVDQEDVSLPHIRAFFFDTIDKANNGRLEVNGRAALALIACGDASIAGRVIVATTARTGGSGGYDGGTEGNPGGGCGGGEQGYPYSSWTDSGGGGGGFGDDGGDGGIASNATRADGGSACGQESLVPLHGGSGGGGGSSGGDSNAGSGGGGGGAIQITSNGTLRVARTAAINASGAGGDGGEQPSGNFGSGGGGGSGGAMLLEAPTVVINGFLAANGGGGGAGICTSGASDGDWGRLNEIPAPGGSSSSGGGGGNGGVGDTAATGGNDCSSSDYNGGGGGGSVGRIRINTDGGDLTYGGNEILTPPANTGDVTFQP